MMTQFIYAVLSTLRCGLLKDPTADSFQIYDLKTKRTLAGNETGHGFKMSVGEVMAWAKNECPDLLWQFLSVRATSGV
jgi:hypothetical protein